MPEDARYISKIYREQYSKYYVDPLVYDVEALSKKITEKNIYWVVCEKINKKPEICGTGLIEKRYTTAFACKAVLKKKYQGKGLSTKLGSGGIIHILRLPEFKNVVRLDSDVRAVNIKSQKLLEKSGGIGYAFIPSYNNFSNKRKFDASKGEPCTNGIEEPAILYVNILNTLWKKRQKEIHLIDNEDIYFFYSLMRNKNLRKMKNDRIIFDEFSGFRTESYQVQKDLYKGMVRIGGYLRKSTLKYLLEKFSSWRLIEWRIPTTHLGRYSIKLALKNQFKVVGYDVGSMLNYDGDLLDNVVMCKFPNGIKAKQFKDLHLTKSNQILVNRVLESIKDQII
ncbi:MAG: hypothetical protein ACFFBP_04030 [Promethearchaeota archaeon]